METRRLRGWRRVAAGMVVTISSVGSVTSASAASTSTPTTADAAALAPKPPAGWTGTHVPTDPSKIPGVTVEQITLSPALCAALNGVRSGAAPGCVGLHYSLGTNHEALPTGTTAPQKGITPSSYAYWHWSYSDWICSIAGCWLASLTLWEDGVANGTYVWQWDVTCTPGGQNTNVQWCGYLHNGGNWPYYAMEFGLNGQFCIGPWGLGCINHGIRRWINDWGQPAGFSSW